MRCFFHLWHKFVVRTSLRKILIGQHCFSIYNTAETWKCFNFCVWSYLCRRYSKIWNWLSYLKAAQLFQRSRHKHTNVVSIHGCLLCAANTAQVHSECCCFFCIVDWKETKNQGHWKPIISRGNGKYFRPRWIIRYLMRKMNE